jgi:phosphatidylinositol-3-phosphatase
MKRSSFLALAVVTQLSYAAVPASKHVLAIVEENHSYSSVIGSSAMPYLNSLAGKYALATNYYGDTHPSIGNYFMLATGQIVTNNDAYNGTVSIDNVVREILLKGKSWKVYAEGLPYAGYTGGDTGLYAKHHNPFAYITDVVNSSVQKMRMVPFTQLASDITNNHVPDFSFIVPNLCNDAHSCSLTTADNWLKAKVPMLLNSAMFKAGGDGILFITFDESFASDMAHGGGHVATVVIGPKAIPGRRDGTFWQHQNLLRTICIALGLGKYPGLAANCCSLASMFQ